MGASRFNAKPKSGLAYLEEHKLIYADLSTETSRARSLAMFLKGCTRLDKRLLGDFISKPENVEVLRAFIGLFDFRSVSFHIVSACCEPIGTATETYRRRYAGIVGKFPIAWRGSTDFSNNRNLRLHLFRIKTRYETHQIY